jgi:hypothetical protein
VERRYTESKENKHLEESSSWDGFKFNLWYALSRHEVTRPFSFQEKAVNSTYEYYLYIIEMFAFLQIAHN